MYYLGAKLGELGANIGLGDQLPGADRADTFQRSERGCNTWRIRSFQPLDPIRNSVAERLNLALVGD